MILAYDSDEAGQKATRRAAALFDEIGVKVRVLKIEGAKDPDEFIKAYGRDAFARLLDKSENQVDYRLAQLQSKFDLADDAQKVAFLQEAAQLIAARPSAVEREIYGGHAAQMAGVTPEAMAQEVSRALRNRLRKEKKQQERRDLAPAAQLQPKARSLRYDNIRSARAEEGVLRLLLLDPALLSKMAGLEGQEFSSPLLGRAFDALRGQVQQGLSPNLAPLAQIFTGEEMDHLAQVASQTMAALACTDAAQDLPVLRPCIGMDKIEIINISRKIGTFETSIEPYEDCCTIFTPPHPKTNPTLDEILAAEAAMPGLAALEAEAAENVEKIYIRMGDDELL